MEAKDRSLNSLWPRVFDAVPCPLILLDAQGNTLCQNRAAAADPVVGADGIAEQAGRARRRQRWYEQARRTRAGCCFEEEVRGAGGEVRHLVWWCVPIVDAGEEVSEIVVVGIEATEWHRRTAGKARRHLAEQVACELQAPLASITSLGGTLARELTGAQAERAALIDQNGRLLLRRLAALLERAAASQEETA